MADADLGTQRQAEKALQNLDRFNVERASPSLAVFDEAGWYGCCEFRRRQAALSRTASIGPVFVRTSSFGLEQFQFGGDSNDL
jgi:hypothetical protein